MAAAVALDYSSLQDLREEAGLHHIEMGEALTGEADAANKYFYVSNKYVVDRDYDDALGPTDVIVYDDGTAVDLAATDPINAISGRIELLNAPAADSVMTADYGYSVASDALVIKRRAEAISWLQNKIRSTIDYTEWEGADVPDMLKTAIRLYGGGLLLIRDYGSSADTDLSSKDGYKKLDEARKILKDYLGDAADDSGSLGSNTVATKSDGNLFPRNRDLSSDHPSSSDDDYFMRHN